MHDLNWKTWGIVFVIALGGTLEVIKRLPEGKAWSTENLRAPKMRPFARGVRAGMIAPAMLAPPAMIRPKAYTPPTTTREQVAAVNAVAPAAAKPEQTNFEHGKTAKAKKGEDDEFEVVIDPKTGKMVKKKKKKKKVAKKEDDKKKKPETKKPEQQITEEDEADKTDSEADIDAAITAALKNGELNPISKKKADDAFMSAEEWIKLLLNKPNLAETNRFIDHYRKNLVTSEVFYKVVNTMLDDNRPEMKKLGIHAAAQVANAMSFQILANAATSSRNDSSVKAKADEALNSYSQVNRVGILKSVLNGGAAASAKIKAAQLVKISAEKNLSAQATGSTGGSTTNTRYRSTYQSFLSVLQNLSSTSSDPGVKQAAGETLAALNNLLGSSQTAVAQQ